MYELEKTDEVRELIAITKSNSGISGPKLAYAHMQLGRLLAQKMSFSPADTTVVAIMRGGIFFAEGIYFELGCRFQLYDPKYEEFVMPETKNIIMVDSVINTGKTIRRILTPEMWVACCVINEKAVSILEKQLYTIRVSKNQFTGSNVRFQKGTIGPDTTMRLFNLI